MTPVAKLVYAVLWTLAVACVIALSLFLATVAYAHPTMDLTPYYTSECCSKKDCRVINADDHPSPIRIKVIKEGYVLYIGEKVITTILHSDKEIRYSPDSHWHLCSYGGKDGYSDGTFPRNKHGVIGVYCLFIPNAGA